jgi:proteasome lid subunit RPN8/RPN11
VVAPCAETDPEQGRLAVPLRDRSRRPAAADDRDRCAGEAFWAIVHSHTHTPAVPSPTDIGLAFYPDALYVLVSLSDTDADAETGAPGIRAWRIVNGEVNEVQVR